MTLNICCEEQNTCCGKDETIAPRVLSKEATKEVLGENLSSLIAIGKDCKPVLFLPYSDQNMSECNQVSDQELTTLLNITVRVPKQALALSYCVCYPPGGGTPYGCWR